MKRILLTAISLAFFTSLQADVLFTIKGHKGRTSDFSSNGKMARIDDKQMPGHVIIDHQSGEFFMVDPERKEIMRAVIDSGGVTDGSPALDVALKDKGSGQKIAGYLTRKYEMTANGESCGTVYASSKLLQNRDVRAIFESMRNMQQFSRGMRGGMSGMMTVCQQANMQLADVIESSGAPMKVIDASGNLVSEVLAVDTDKTFAGNHYQLPAGMKVVDMSERMNQATQQTQQMMENMPDMDELMKQLQQGGGQMTDEMQQQMEKLQKMFQQQGQQ